VLVLSLSLVLATAAIYSGWRFYSAYSNNGRAVQILYWIDQFLCGHGHVTGINWTSKSEFEVPLRLASNVFHRAKVKVKIANSRVPWFKRKTSPEAETLSFCADLDYRPALNVDLNNMRWFARSSRDNNPTAPGWKFESVTPVLLTTRLDWGKEMTAAVQQMLSVANKEDLQVTFRKVSPHFCVTLPLEKITPRSELGSEMPLFELLNSIATVSSAEAS
jgi:hypothetical protein